jgi:hypothetical protein
MPGCTPTAILSGVHPCTTARYGALNDNINVLVGVQDLQDSPKLQ